MRGNLRTCLLPLLMLMPFGCAGTSNVSTIMDPASFPPGRYGLYEAKSGQLILTYDLKADETFGIRLTTYHNLYFLLDLMRNVRQAIAEDRLLDYRDEFFDRYGMKDNDRGF